MAKTKVVKTKTQSYPGWSGLNKLYINWHAILLVMNATSPNEFYLAVLSLLVIPGSKNAYATIPQIKQNTTMHIRSTRA